MPSLWRQTRRNVSKEEKSLVLLLDLFKDGIIDIQSEISLGSLIFRKKV